MINIFNTFKKKSALMKSVTNALNKVLYQFTGDSSYLLPDKIESYVNDGYRGNIHVYAVTTAIANRCTGFKFKMVNGETELTNSRVMQLLKRPNPMQTWDDFLKSAVLWNRIVGNCYIYMISPDNGLNKGIPTELWLLPAHVVEIIGGGVTQPVKAYKINLGVGANYEIPAENIIHWKEFNPNYDTSGSQLYGMSPLQAGLLTIQASNEGYKALNKAYQNGAPAGILTGTENSELEYTPEQIEALNNRWSKKYGSVDNYMKVIFSRNPLNWIQMGYSVVDMNIIGLMKYTLQDVCNLYQVPNALFSSDQSTYNNVSEARKAIYTDAVIPMLDQFTLLLNTYLVPLFKEQGELTYDTSQIPELNADLVTLSTALQNAYFLTGNEKREKIGLPRIEDDPMMDVVMYPSNLITGVEIGSTNANDLSL